MSLTGKDLVPMEIKVYGDRLVYNFEISRIFVVQELEDTAMYLVYKYGKPAMHYLHSSPQDLHDLIAKHDLVEL